MSLIDNFLQLRNDLCSVHGMLTVPQTLSLRPLDLTLHGRQVVAQAA